MVTHRIVCTNRSSCLIILDSTLSELGLMTGAAFTWAGFVLRTADELIRYERCGWSLRSITTLTPIQSTM